MADISECRNGAPHGAVFPHVLAVLAALLPFVLAFSARGMTVVLVAAAVAAGIDQLRSRRFHVRADMSMVAIVAALLVWGLASALWEQTSGLAVAKTGQLLGLGIAGMVAVAAAGQMSAGEGRRAILALCWGLVAMAGVVAVEAAFNLPLARLRYHLPPESAAINIGIYKNLGAAGTVFATPAIGFTLLRRRWLTAGAAALALAACVVLTHSSTGLVSMAVVAVVGLSALLWRRLPAVVLAAVVVAAFAAAPLALKLPPSERLAVEQSWMPPSLVHRTVIWRFAAEHAIQRPILGWGLDASRELPGADENVVIHAPYHGQIIDFVQQILPLHPHDFIIQLWLELGVVGMALFLGLIFALLRWVWRRPGGELPVCAAALAAPIVIGAASYGLWQSWWVACFWLAAAVVTAARAR